MIAGRRARRRTLIRPDAMTSVLARTLSAVDSVVRRAPDPKNSRQSGQVTFSNGISTENTYSTPVPSNDPASSSQYEMIRYLRQLSALHDAGVLNDNEFAAARGRLFGS